MDLRYATLGCVFDNAKVGKAGKNARMADFTGENDTDVAQTIAFRDGPAFEAWLDEHSDHRPGVWLKLARKASGIASLTSDEAVDIGLCHGWISGQRKALDDVYYLQKYVPRRPRSRWSRVNVRKVEELIAAGRMRPTGLVEVEAAKTDGRWDAAYESQREATVPADLAAALAVVPGASQAFAALGRTDRYAVILELLTARSPDTRAAHLRKAIAALEARSQD
jgi:uncharacterized protein YdeI (YjbR/CyaY-like superfamily)